MRKRIHKRTLSLLLAVALLVPIVPTVPSVNAAETDTTRNDTISAEELSTEVVTLDEAAVPDIIGVADARERNHVRRRYDEEGDNLNTVVFQNADGSRTMYMYDFPVKYVDENGDIQDISLDIADLPGGKGGFRSEGSHAVTTFSPELDGGIILADSDRALRLVPERPLQTQRFDVTADYSARRVDEKTVEYTYDEYTTLEYSLTYTGFKEDIVVSQYTGQTEYTFTLYTNGLTLTQIDGSYFLTDEAGEIQATIGDIIVFTADERNNTFGQLLSTTIVENEEYLLTIVLDADYLSDPQTVYPIRIDPTIDLNYDNYGSDAIEDVTINSNAGSMGSSGSIFVGLRETKGIARTLMRFPDLPISTMAGATVTSATVEIRDLMCETTSLTIECYPFMGSSWTEDSTWATISSQSLGTKLSSKTITYSTGASLETIHRYSFNITAAVQDWVDGDVALSKGIIFKATSSIENGSTYNYRTFASFNRASYKPSLSVTYNLGISLNYGSFDLDEGGTKTLTATTIPAGQTVTWSSSNTTVATVSTSGTVTAKKAGAATITAKLSDGTKDTCTVYVTLADGLYYISNQVVGYYLATSGSVENGAEVLLKAKATGTNRNYQLWNIIHLSSGKYVIRPIYRRASALDRDGTNAEIYDIGTSNSLSDVPARTRWGIHYTSSGYVITNNGSSSYAMTVASGATANSNVYVASMLNNTTCFWSFEKAYGMFLYDLSTNTTTTTETVKYLKTGEYVIPQDIDLSIQLYGSESSRTWYTGNTAVASVDITGGIRALENGEAIITLTSMIYGTNYSASFKVKVSVIRMTGYELDYDEGDWNYLPVMNRTNCYAYALNNQIDTRTDDFGCNFADDDPKQQPGAFYNNNLGSSESAITFSTMDIESIIQAVEKDFEKFNSIYGTSLYFQRLNDPNDECPEGTYKIALVLCSGIDYHWYRQDSDGYWSHKQGLDPIRRTDADGNLIVDPRNADLGIYTSLDEPIFFAISPWNNMYSGTELSYGTYSTDSMTASDSIQLVPYDLIERIEIGMKIDEVVEILGFHGADVGNSTIIHRYYTEENQQILICYQLTTDGTYQVSRIYWEE